jgi:hypothetical protein
LGNHFVVPEPIDESETV